MTINCHDLNTFTATCANLVREGLTFNAQTTLDGFTITLTGGY
jgi:hypothetical protein